MKIVRCTLHYFSMALITKSNDINAPHPQQDLPHQTCISPENIVMTVASEEVIHKDIFVNDVGVLAV